MFLKVTYEIKIIINVYLTNLIQWCIYFDLILYCFKNVFEMILLNSQDIRVTIHSNVLK